MTCVGAKCLTPHNYVPIFLSSIIITRWNKLWNISVNPISDGLIRLDESFRILVNPSFELISFFKSYSFAVILKRRFLQTRSSQVDFNQNFYPNKLTGVSFVPVDSLVYIKPILGWVTAWFHSVRIRFWIIVHDWDESLLRICNVAIIIFAPLYPNKTF